MNLYFDEHKDYCSTINDLKEYMADKNIKEMKVHKAEKQKVKGYFWCYEYLAVGDKDEGSCGKQCEKYSPRNGKSGCCRHYTTTFYEATEETKILRI